ncbi:MAG: TIGR00366 family protein [Bacteroidetes bacterium]|jgi:uncharacterized ion transporter superfamily protein YfcC|nr:TIGR00366 family protein [Bacteroidota bacterium]
MKFKLPHTLVLMFGLMVVSLVLTWVVPSGEFERTVTETGRDVVEAGTFTEVDEKEYLSPLSLLTVVPRALADAQGIIFFILIIGGSIKVIRDTGSIDALLGRIVQRFGSRPAWLIFLMMFAFAAASATLGIAEEYVPFAIILVSLCAALRLDAITAIGTLVVGYGIGYGIAFMNPFTLVIAQEISGLQPLSGMWFRLSIAPVFLTIGFHHVWSYARRVQEDPANSYMVGVKEKQIDDANDYPAMTTRRKVVLAATGLALIGLVVGIKEAGWYLTELGAMFVGLAIVVGFLSGKGASDTATLFSKGAAELTGTALLIGFARAIALLMEDGLILDTVVNALATPLSYVGAEFSAVGMLFIQSILNFFIPSGSGQAFVTMPLMAPIGDLVGVSRQVAVLAYQFGDGLMNMIVPTNAVLMGILGLAGIPYAKWFRFVWPVILKLLAAASVAMVLAVWVGYS